jgi:DeoR/GlpR family transcriptional regulator of sugar metabolism
MESDLDAAQLKQSMVRVWLVAGVVDASKIGKSLSSVFAQPDEIDWLITDARADGDGQGASRVRRHRESGRLSAIIVGALLDTPVYVGDAAVPGCRG